MQPTPLNDRAIAEVVKRAAHTADYHLARFSGHLVTTASAEGVDKRTIMEQIGPKTRMPVRHHILVSYSRRLYDV